MSPTGLAATFISARGWPADWSSDYEPGASPIAYTRTEVRSQNYTVLGMMKGLVVEQS